MTHHDNFNTLCRAIQNCDAALLECVEASSGKKMALVCAINKADAGPPDFVPLARMLDEPILELILPAQPSDLDWSPDQN